MQHAEAIQKFVESYAEVYKTGGKKQADSFVQAFLPLLGNFDEEASPIGQYMRSIRYNTDMDSLNKEFMYDTNKEWTSKEKQARFENLQATNQHLYADIAKMWSEEMLNKSNQKLTLEKIKEVASEIAKNYAQAFEAQSIGGYYQVSAKQLDLITQMTNLELQEALADFDFNKPIRESKRDFLVRKQNLNNWKLGLNVQGIELGRKGNQRLFYAEKTSEIIGNMFNITA